MGVKVRDLPDAQMHQHLASFLFSVRRIGTRDFDHAAVDALDMEARASIVRAEIIHERVVVGSN
ncbi:MAG: hypothetical protein JWM06_1502 [Actinomycetia bacterium]|nr:hypothetical protein [Actinomycetes bacterium]